VDTSGKPIDQLQCYCTTSTCGAGMLDAAKAVLAAAGVQAVIDVSPAAPQPGQIVTLSAANSRVASGRSIASYNWTVTDSAGIVTNITPSGPTLTLTPIRPGSFSVQLAVADNLGASSSVSQTIEVTVPPSSDGGGGALGVQWLVLLAAAVVAVARSRRQAPQ